MIGHRTAAVGSIVLVGGVPVVDPLTALLQSAALLTLSELVVAIDHLIRSPGGRGRVPPVVDLRQLVDRAGDFRGKGARAIRLALSFARVGAESRMETLTRLLLIAYGLDSYFEMQANIEDARGWIGRFDFVCSRKKVIVEYDGEQHRRDNVQYRKDLRRLERAHAAGYTVIRLLSEDVLRRPEESARRVAEALGVSTRVHRLQRELLRRA